MPSPITNIAKALRADRVVGSEEYRCIIVWFVVVDCTQYIQPPPNIENKEYRIVGSNVALK